jgi:hypothetical protein
MGCSERARCANEPCAAAAERPAPPPGARGVRVSSRGATSEPDVDADGVGRLPLARVVPSGVAPAADAERPEGAHVPR